ncbi:HAD-IA family hydrolase [Streptacidiphilus sp. N1-12]
MNSRLPQLNGYRALVFDLDGTLYPSLPDLERQYKESLRFTAMSVANCSAAAADSILHAMRAAGQHAVEGLARLSGTDPNVLLEEIYFRLDLAGIREDRGLASVLSILASRIRLLVLTNSSRGHAERVLDRLGLGCLPIRTYGMEDADFKQKPDPVVYRKLLLSETLTPTQLLYFDDASANIDTACSMGISTVHIVPAATHRGAVDLTLPATAPAWASSTVESFLREVLTSKSSGAIPYAPPSGRTDPSSPA